MPANPILSPLDAADLEAKGLLLKGSTPGFQKIHLRRLHRWSDEEYNNHPLEPQPVDPRSFVEIPVSLISRETLIHVGFSEVKANEIWNQWTNWPSDGPGREIDPDGGGLQMSFFHFLTGGVEGRPDATDDSDAAWYACLNDCGINSETQASIMDPGFTYFRLSDSCLHWIRDTIEMRYRGLELIGDASRKREMELQRSASRPGGSGESEGGGSQSGGAISRAPASSASSGALAQQAASAQLQQSTPGISANIWNSASAATVGNAPGHTVLYKGIDRARVAGLFDEQGNLDDITTLLTLPPTDFNCNETRYYFTPNPQVAEYHAQYAKRRVDVHSVVIVVIRIPNCAIESLPECDLRHLHWPSNDWKELIWRNRARKRLSGRLNEIADTFLVIASTSRRSDSVYVNMDSHNEITENCALKVGPDGQAGSSPVSVQYVIHYKGRDWLEENIVSTSALVVLAN